MNEVCPSVVPIWTKVTREHRANHAVSGNPTIPLSSFDLPHVNFALLDVTPRR